MGNSVNKNSKYVASLVSFILDTKPYHSKLTEIAEEYQFSDSMAVKMEETSFIRTKIRPTYLYNYFSSGDSSFTSMPLKQLHLNQATHTRGMIQVGRDENTDMASVPFVYSKKKFDGIGVADVLLERADALEPMVEGLDYFQSHGSFQLQLKAINDQAGVFNPTWADTRDDNLISTASALTRQLANDITNPNSAVSKVKDLMVLIQGSIDGMVDGTTAQLELDKINVILATPMLTDDYEALLNALADATVNPEATPPVGFDGWIGEDTLTQKYVSSYLSQLSPSLYFGSYTDTGVREAGKAGYDNITSAYLNVSNIVATAAAQAGDTWSLVSADSTVPLWNVFSSVSGFVGTFIAGDTFATQTISFATTFVSQAPIGTTIKIQNHNRLVFGTASPLETWNITKVNPLAYSRPVLASTRYGHIQNLSGVVGDVTLIDPSLPTGTIILKARAGGLVFDLTSSVEPSYTAVIEVNVPFNDGRLGFTIVTGSAQPFVQADKFYIDIVNDPAKAVDFDLSYGFDLASYDHQNLKDDHGEPLNFVYDTRFVDYDVALMNLQVAQNAISGRQWRIRAIPKLSDPIATLKKDGSGPNNSVDLQDSTSGIAPDVALNAAPLYSMAGDSNPSVPDLRLYRADTFEVEWSDDGFNTVTSVGTIGVGNTFVSVLHGIQFTLNAGTKPFLAVLSDDGLGQPIVEGGDIFTFSVQNKAPMLTNKPLGLSSSHVPRLAMHGDGFHEAPAAHWVVKFTSPTAYELTGINTEGTVGSLVGGSVIVGTMTTPGTIAVEGNSFNGLGVHFTIKVGDAGVDLGDTLSFDTFTRKPSFLVHGSVSGWQKEAVVGESYWNGLIGFTIEKPKAKLYDQSRVVDDSNPATDDYAPLVPESGAGVWTTGGGTVSLSRLRFDAPNSTYALVPAPAGLPSAWPAAGWSVVREDIGYLGFLALDGTFTDTYVTIVSAGVVSPVELQLVVTADDFVLWNAQDTVIIRPALALMNPAVGEFVHVDKRVSDRLSINLNYDNLATRPDLRKLAGTRISSDYANVFTGPNGLPLSLYSPEAMIFGGGLSNAWIPLSLVPRDSSTSIAEFSDSASQYDVISLGTGQKIGSIVPEGSNKLWPVQMVWDKDFFEEYLPLNAEANLVTLGNGFNDYVRAHISESVKFLVGGGSLTTDSMFTDKINIVVKDHSRWSIIQRERDSISALIEDDPFGGFLPGYDNTPFDLAPGEDVEGDGMTPFDATPFGYDTGLPLTGHFNEAQALAALTNRTVAQQARLNALLGLLDHFLNGDLANTSLVEFLQNISVTDMFNEAKGLALLATLTPSQQARLISITHSLDPFLNESITNTSLEEFLHNIGTLNFDVELLTNQFGYPARGLGIDITIGAGGVDTNKPSTESSATSIQEAMVFMAIDSPYSYDTFNYDIGGYDSIAERTAIIYSGSLPPVPNPTGAFTTYEDYDTPLAVVGMSDDPSDFQARIFEVSFNAPRATLEAMPAPSFMIWLPGKPAPQIVAVVDKVALGRYRISVPSATEAKLILT